MGLRFPEDLAAWRRWHERRHPLRLARQRVRGVLPGATPAPLVEVRRGGPDADVVVALEATHASVRAAVVEVLTHLDPARVVVVAPAGSAPLLTAWPPPTVVALDELGTALGRPRAVLAAGHYTPIGAAVHARAAATGAPFMVSQHGLLTPLAPPLPPDARLLAWSEADAAFWSAGRPDVTSTVVGSQLLWQAGTSLRSAPSVAAAPRLTYLGQLHGAELGRADLARAARDFCGRHGAVYRPHPSERDRLSRLTHARWRRAGIEVDAGTVPLADLDSAVVSVFSTGVLEAASRGRDAWVDFPDPPRWLEEFWERYAMSHFGQAPTPAPERPTDEPAHAIARLLEAL